MIGLGLALLAGGIVLFAVGVIAEVKHPTGGDDLTGKALLDGALIAAAGIVFLLLGWLA